MTSDVTPHPPQDPAQQPPLDPDRLVIPDGWRVEIVEVADSTNTLVADRARSGEPGGLVIVTEHQTKGRGRLDREWETPPRVALTFSVLLRPELEAASWPWLPLITGYAVHAALADRLPEASLKWPNDVVIEDRKLSGILVERVDTPEGPAAVLGTGINVNQSAAQLPTPAAGGLAPTSLLLELGEPVDRTALLSQVLGSLHGLMPLLADPKALAGVYAAECSTIGREVDCHLPSGEVLRGEAIGVADSGALCLATPDETLTVSAGDVVHVRAAG